MSSHYDVIIIGTGAGGATLAHRLASSGKRILLLERGDYLRREPENWDSRAVFTANKYKAHETWYDKEGRPFHPGQHYYVGGQTKFYGAALFRLREPDFGEVRHHGGLSPPGPSPTKTSPHTTTRPSVSTSPTARAARTRRSRRLRARTPIRPSATSRVSRSCMTT